MSIRRSAFAEVTEDSKTLLPHVRLSLFYPSLSLSLLIHVGETDRLLLREGCNRDAGTGLRASIYSR